MLLIWNMPRCQSGKVSKELGALSPGALHYTWWLTSTKRIICLYIITSNLFENLKKQVKVVMLYGDHVFSVRPSRRDHFGATYFVALRFLHRSFRQQFGALWQFTYLGFELGLGLWVSVSKKHRILAPKRVAPKWSRQKVVDPALCTSPGILHNILKRQIAALDNFPNEQNLESDKILNWTKSRMDKIPNGQNPEWTKSQIQQKPEKQNPKSVKF